MQPMCPALASGSSWYQIPRARLASLLPVHQTGGSGSGSALLLFRHGSLRTGLASLDEGHGISSCIQQKRSRLLLHCVQQQQQETAASSPLQAPVNHQAAQSVSNILGEKGWSPETEQAVAALGIRFTGYVVNLALKQVKSAKAGWGFFQWVAAQDGFTHNVYTYAAMIDCLGRGRDPATLPALLQHMRAAGVKPNTVVMTALITAYGRSRNVEEAIKVFELMVDPANPGCKPNVVTYTVLIDMLSKAGRHDDASSVYRRMVEAGCRLSVHTYTVLIHSLGEAGKFEEAYKLFQRMSETGCKPTAITHSAVISAYAKAGEADKALLCLQNMKAAGLRPARSMYVLLSKALQKVGRTQEADALMKQAYGGTVQARSSKREEDGAAAAVVSSNSVAVEESGNAVSARAVVAAPGPQPKQGKMLYVQVGGKVVKLNPADVSVNSVVRLVSNWGPSAVQVLQHLGISKKSHEFVVEVLKRVRDPDAAWNFFQWLKNEEGYKHSVYEYNKVIDLVGQARDLKKIDELLNEMQAQGLEVSVVTFNTIINAYVKANALEGALQVFQQMTECKCQPNQISYTILIDAMGRAGEHDKAMSMYEQMLEARCPPNNQTFAVILRTLGRLGKLQEARDLLRKMPEKGALPNAFAFTTVMAACLEAKEVAMAVEVYEEMVRSGTKITRMSAATIEEVLREAGRVEEAEEFHAKRLVQQDPVVKDIVLNHFLERRSATATV